MAPALHVVVATAVTGLLLLWQRGDRAGRPIGPSLAHAAGLSALLWAYGCLVLGLLVSTRPLGPTDRRPELRWRNATLTAHRQLGVAVVALTLLHALTFALAAPGGSLLAALVPGASAERRWGLTLGVVGLYLAALLGPSYHLRRRIGRHMWLLVHQLVALSYAVSLWHALDLGSDLTHAGWPRSLTWGLQLPLLVLLARRLSHPLRQSDELDPAVRRGRFSSRRHTVSRAVLVLSIAGTFAVVLAMGMSALVHDEPRPPVLGGVP